MDRLYFGGAMEGILLLVLVIGGSIFWMWCVMADESDRRIAGQEPRPIEEGFWPLFKLLYFGLVVWWFLPVYMLFDWLLREREHKAHLRRLKEMEQLKWQLDGRQNRTLREQRTRQRTLV